jgi:membrane fusion protein, multidrug efflux system
MIARLLIVVLVAGGLGACSEKTAPAPAAVPVMVAEALIRPMPVRVQAVGNVVPAESVTVRSQVTGQLAEVHFTEGQDVRR